MTKSPSARAAVDQLANIHSKAAVADKAYRLG
jgi:hypothetical protein